MGGIGNMFSKLRDAIRGWGAPEPSPQARLYVGSIPCPDPHDASVPADIITYPGDEVVCDGPEQHVIAKALFTIKVGDPSAGINEQFVWFQAPPAFGTEFIKIRCQHCDGRWAANGMHLHFKGGWR